MRKWVTVFSDGEGDRICLDAGLDPPPVVFDQHDWFDAGSGANGHVLAPTLLDFLTAWSRVCFQLPRELWWPEVFNSDGPGVNWSSDEFDDRFRLPPIG